MHIKQNPNRRRSIAFTEEMLDQLDLVASKQHITTSELIRRYIEKGLQVDKSKGDIDFIRKQIREELESCMDHYFDRLTKLILKEAAMSVTMNYFTSKLFSVYILKHKNEKEYYEMLNKAMKRSYAYLAIRDTGIDEACTKIFKGEQL